MSRDLFSEKQSEGIAFLGIKNECKFSLHCISLESVHDNRAILKSSHYTITVLSSSWWYGINSSKIYRYKFCVFYNTSTHNLKFFLLLSSLLFVGGTSVSGLQCSLYECDGFCGHDLSFGVHVPCHPSTAHLHGFSRTGTVT